MSIWGMYDLSETNMISYALLRFLLYCSDLLIFCTIYSKLPRIQIQIRLYMIDAPLEYVLIQFSELENICKFGFQISGNSCGQPLTDETLVLFGWFCSVILPQRHVAASSVHNQNKIDGLHSQSKTLGFQQTP